ncbi:MAG: hypothetical protein CL843_08805 [Crocinitomicaceae bacterium]|nr:hypothetical protein [Crocinitomicaceae bacterium]|tara:strand:- start:81 stop:479 length:399 start_codon:yes stop_codon:yes gene_type:complete
MSVKTLTKISGILLLITVSLAFAINLSGKESSEIHQRQFADNTIEIKVIDDLKEITTPVVYEFYPVSEDGIGEKLGETKANSSGNTTVKVALDVATKNIMVLRKKAGIDKRQTFKIKSSSLEVDFSSKNLSD